MGTQTNNESTTAEALVNLADAFEKVAQANSLTQIDENIAQEVLIG